MTTARTTTELRSLHPNHVHQIDPSLCLLYYTPGGKQHLMTESKFYKNKLDAYAKVKLKCWRYVRYDHASGVVDVRYYEAEGENQDQFVMNTLTGAWCQFTGINANCWEILNDVPYFGGNDGNVYQWDYGAGDYIDSLDYPITATVQTAFNYFESRGHLKRWTMVRPILTTDGSVTPGVGLNIDFGTDAPISIPSTRRREGAYAPCPPRPWRRS